MLNDFIYHRKDTLELASEYQAFQLRVEEKIGEARLALIMQDFFVPMLVVLNKDGITETEVDISILDSDGLSDHMKGICKDPGVRALALILDAFTLVRDIKGLDVVPDSIENEKETMETVMVFMYLGEDKNYIRRCLYSRRGEKGEGKYWFTDLGWQEMNETTGRFGNPFSTTDSSPTTCG